MEQFDFANNWEMVKPHLKKQSVIDCLVAGMRLLDGNFKEGDAPWKMGRGKINGHRATPDGLEWYQPWGRCHHIAPFAWAIGREVYPDLTWLIMSGELHTIAVGWTDDKLVMVMDILLFDDMTAKESYDFAIRCQPRVYMTADEYIKSLKPQNPSEDQQ